MNMNRIAELVLLSLALPAWSADNPPAVDPGNLTDLDLQTLMNMEVTITAEKRESRLLDTPLAVAAIPTLQLQRQNIASLEDVQAVTPNLTFGQFLNFSLVSLRGIGTDFGSISAEPAVATFKDGVYQGASSSQTVPSFDLQRIEVLRGPQGTLYGRNSTGGAINFITRDPTLTNEGNAALVVGDYDHVTADFGVSGPLGLGDTLAGRLSVRYETRSGYRHNDYLDEGSDDLESQSAAGSLLIRPNGTFSLVLRGDYINRDSARPNERISDALGFNTLFGGSFTPAPANSTHFQNNVPTKTNAEVWGASATANVDFKGKTLRSITAYRENSFSSQEDLDGSTGDILAVNYPDGTRQFTQEFNVLGSSGHLDWLLGAFYFHSRDTTFFDMSGGALTTFFGANTLTYDATQDSKSVAGFGQTTYHVTDRLNITGGLRYTRDEKRMDQSILLNHAIDTCGVTTADSWSALTDTVSADYHFTDNAMVYGRISRGYKGGGINSVDCADGFDPEFVNAFEAGVRGSAFARSLSGAITAFYYGYKDIQFTTYGPTSIKVDNVGGATIAGLELEFNYLPAFLDGLRLDGSASYLHSEYDDQMVMDPFLTGPYQIGGNQLVRAPARRANLGIEYRFGPTTNSGLTLRAETFYSDHYFHDIFNGKAALQSHTEQPSYTISNLRVIWERRDHDLEVQAFVENIEDNQYAYRGFVGGLFGGIIGQFSPPRTVGVRISAYFGG